MIGFLANLGSSLILGLLTPLTAVCVLPLFPGFLSFLAGKLGDKSDKKVFITLGVLVTVGVLVFMFLFGLIFTTIFRTALNDIIEVITPIAFTILGIISIFLIFNIDMGKFMPKFHAPITKGPKMSAFSFGFFFGAIVLPCNPGFIAIMFTKTVAVSGLTFVGNLLNFLVFGLGMAAPLLIFSFISYGASTTIISFLTKRKKQINLVAGLIMLGISLYYLFFVFKIQNLLL